MLAACRVYLRAGGKYATAARWAGAAAPQDFTEIFDLTPQQRMFDRLIYFSIHNKLIIGLLTLALVVWGGYSLTRLPIDAVPDITTNQVIVYTVAPALAAADIERLVSFPVEQSVATIPGREQVRSFSRFGLSVVTIVFEEDIDIYWARQQVAERLREAESQIPAGVGRPEMAPVTTGLGEIYQYLVRAKPGYERRYGTRELRTIQDWLVRRQLLGTPGVADVSSFGGQLKQYEIALDPARLRALNVTVEQVYQAVARNNENVGGAYLDQKPTAHFIRTEGLAENEADLGNIIVRATAGGLPVLVRDVAQVRLGSAVRYGAMTRNAEGEVTGGIVLMLKGANANEVIQAVKQRMATVRKSLPEGVVIDVYLDRSDLVGRAIHTVSKNLLEGALIVVFVLVLFLGNWRAGLVVASVIPLAMLFAISLMYLFGVSGNLMSLGAIDFGLIVDGAVIIVEAIVHRLHQRTGPGLGAGGKLSQEQLNEETYAAAAQIRSSAAFGEIIILIVYLPLLALGGIEGKMFGPMAQTVAFAILGAFILSLTYVPMMSALLLSRKTHYAPTVSDRLMAWFEARYRPPGHVGPESEKGGAGSGRSPAGGVPAAVPHPGRRVYPPTQRGRLRGGNAHAHRLVAELHHRKEPAGGGYSTQAVSRSQGSGGQNRGGRNPHRPHAH